MFDQPISTSRPTYFSLELFITDREDSNRAPSTIANYRKAVTRFFATDGIPADPSLITRDHVLLFRGELRRAGMPPGNMAWYQRHLFAYLKWLYERGDIERDPRRGVSRIVVPQRPLEQATGADMVKVLAVLMDRPGGEKQKIEHYYRNIAIVRLLWSSGLRRSEVSRLTLEGLDLQRRLLEVPGKGARTRRVPFDSRTKAAIIEYILNERGELPGPLFQARRGGALSPDALSSLWKSVQHRAGVTISLHSMRRGFARRMRTTGLDLGETAALMGHRTLEMTKRYSQEGEADAAIDTYRKLIG